LVSQPPAACFMTRMTAPSRQTCGFTRLPCALRSSPMNVRANRAILVGLC
jgi:hypothetical protein